MSDLPDPFAHYEPELLALGIGLLVSINGECWLVSRDPINFSRLVPVEGFIELEGRFFSVEELIASTWGPIWRAQLTRTPSGERRRAHM